MENSWESKKILAYGKRFSVFTSIMLVLLFAFSCSNLIMNDGGSLIIAVPGARAASASSFTIELTGTNGTPQRKTVAGGSSVQFDDLAPDTYSIVVEGMDTNNKVVLGGASSATVVAGKTASARVELVEGVGDFEGLVEAIAAGGIVKILKSIDVKNTLSPQANSPVTILPAYQDVTLKNTGSGYLFEVKSGNLTIGGGEHTITLDGNGVKKSIIQMSGGTATLASNGIIRNAASTGVNLSSGDGTFNIDGGTITGNISSSNGGGIILGSGTINMNSGTITGNTSTFFGGGGVSITSSAGIFNFLGGSITGNTASNGKGVYITSGTLTMSGSAVFGSSDDVYLASGKTITITGKLTGGDTVATITPEDYKEVQVLSNGTDSFDFLDAVSKFAVTPNGAESWKITTNGTLVRDEGL